MPMLRFAIWFDSDVSGERRADCPTPGRLAYWLSEFARPARNIEIEVLTDAPQPELLWTVKVPAGDHPPAAFKAAALATFAEFNRQNEEYAAILADLPF